MRRLYILALYVLDPGPAFAYKLSLELSRKEIVSFLADAFSPKGRRWYQGLEMVYLQTSVAFWFLSSSDFGV